MHTISLVGQKGGTGKTTLAQNLGVEAARFGRTVAIVDLDPQISATSWGDRRASFDPNHPTVISAQVARLGPILEEAARQGVDLVILDTPGKHAEAALAAVRQADLVLVPVLPMVNDIETLTRFRDLVEMAGKSAATVVLNNAPIQGSRHVDARETAVEYGYQVAPVVLYHRAAYYDAPLAGQGVSEFAPASKAAAEITELYEYTNMLLKKGRKSC